jgi:hypothetical protein
MNQSEAEMNFFAAYDACRAKDYGCVRAGVTSTSEDKGREALQHTNGIDLTESLKRFHSRQFIPAREYLPRVDLHV